MRIAIVAGSLAALLGATAASGPALAAASKGAYLGKTAEEITASLESQGYQVRKVETEDGLLEAYALIDGKRYEIYVDPSNGTIVKIEDD